MSNIATIVFFGLYLIIGYAIVTRRGGKGFEGPHLLVFFFLWIYGFGQLYSIEVASYNSFVETFYVLDIKEVVYKNVILYLFFIAAYIFAGYVFKFDNAKMVRFNVKINTNSRNRVIFFVLILLVSLMATNSLIVQSGGDLLTQILDPQKLYFETSGANSNYTSNGYLILLATLSGYCAFYLYAEKEFYEINFSVIDYIIFFGMSLSYIFYCYVSSNRGQIANFMMVFIIIRSCVGKKIPIITMTFLSGGVIYLMAYMTSTRLGIDLSAAFDVFLASIVFYGGGAGIINTSLINDFYPTELRYYGLSFMWVLAAPIPRVIWPNKPLVALDEIVANVVYGYQDDALHTAPPGIFGEAIINFGPFFGVVFLVLFFSAYLRISRHFMLTAASGSFYHFLIYTIVLVRMGYSFMTSSINFSVMNSLILVVIISIIYKIQIKFKNIGV